MKKRILILIFIIVIAGLGLLGWTVTRQDISSVTPSPTQSPTPSITPTSLLNFSGPTPLNTQTPNVITATPTLFIPTSSDPVFYTVQSGDSLADIAKQFNIDLAGLARANHITNLDLIFIGQKLLIDTAPITAPEATISEGKQIIVVLSDQMVYAYENGVLVKRFEVGTGKKSTPTVTGQFKIELKFEKADMTGPDYHIKDVPWVMYFHNSYGFHGAPWNPDLYQTSHGCVNMLVEDANWLFDWGPIGTDVLVLP